jgi:Holliday junction resolvasome RuvABC ATP-dependent DNA helicase subunit
MMYLVFLGAPGAGKGTQAAIISKKLGLVPKLICKKVSLFLMR